MGLLSFCASSWVREDWCLKFSYFCPIFSIEREQASLYHWQESATQKAKVKVKKHLKLKEINSSSYSSSQASYSCKARLTVEVVGLSWPIVWEFNPIGKVFAGGKMDGNTPESLNLNTNTKQHTSSNILQHATL